ncbi:hypothetical protein C4568_03720 [Candidatus Parcubacteria bacterium]|nr:MAG: hypothetical protein C4568_03720 [Candidatus Parcubacteria bacterium]
MAGGTPKLHEKQIDVAQSKARFKVIRAGRRSGKTTFEIENMLFKAVSGKGKSIFYVAPTMKQARSIVWESLKARLGGIGDLNEARLEAKVPTDSGEQSHIHVFGFEARENFRGMKADHITFDEVDTCKDFFIGWQEIFRPALIDTAGTADFIGTPKKENPNLRRLEKESENDLDWQCFQFKTSDNPHIPVEEIEKAKAEMDSQTYKQEILAEYVENAGALFKYTALIDTFTNTITKSPEKYLVIDVADDGSDTTKFSFWQGLEEYRRETFSRMNTESIVMQTREYQQEERIPMSQTIVDAIGVGAGVASNSLLDGIVGFKSSYGPIRTDIDPVRLPNVHYLKDAPLTSEYKNIRSQCVFTLADHVNNHKIASKCTGRDKEVIIEELATYQDASQGDGKRMATPKEDVKELIGRSPDDSDTWIMRMYFVIREKMLPHQSEDAARLSREIEERFSINQSRQSMNSTR